MYADLGECDDEVQEFIAKNSVAYLLDKKIINFVWKIIVQVKRCLNKQKL